jgi:protein involved in polysaccharide export with SLBB domain
MLKTIRQNVLFIALITGTIVQFAAADSTATLTSMQTASASTGDSVRPLPFKPGDALQIITYPDSNAFPKGLYSIDGEGFVDFPIIGYVKVIDMSAEALSKLLSEKYVDFMRYPYMKIRPLIRVSLTGGFLRPGLYWIDPHTSLWEAVQVAGGTQRGDGFKKLKWERSRVVVNKDLVPLLQEGKSLYQIGLQTGDQVTIIQRPQQSGWDVFRTDILPILSIIISTGVSAFTVYTSMQYYNNSRPPAGNF